MTMATVKLKKSLSTESGKVVKAGLGSLEKVMAKSGDFAKHKTQLAAKRQQWRKYQRAEAIAELKIYKQFLSTLLLDSMADDDGTTEKLVPIIETVEAGLASKDASAVSRALSVTNKQINGNAKIKVRQYGQTKSWRNNFSKFEKELESRIYLINSFQR